MTAEIATEPLSLENTYRRLPERFYASARPTPVREPHLVRLNRPLAAALGLDPEALASSEGIETLSGNRIPEGATPWAMAYAGHQFGRFVPTLGDGRAITLGERVDSGGVRRDIQLKGCGQTPFSSRGDGRAGLGSVLREYIVSEGMAGLGIPTTRALAMIRTGEQVLRWAPEPGGILTRVAASHVRVGTFEYFYRRGDTEAVKALADYVIDRHYPQLSSADNPYKALIEAVASRTGELIARWLLVGFIHGVMNTDNVSVVAETLDYGPCAFLDSYDPATVYSSIDTGGRYAYNQQPQIGQWNLVQFAECLLSLLAEDEEQALTNGREALAHYVTAFEATYHAGLAAKIGLAEQRDGDTALAFDLLERMAEQGADFTLTFRRLADAVDRTQGDRADARTLFNDPTVFDDWASRWRDRLDADSLSAEDRRAAMRKVNPAYIPRNHRIQQAIDAAEAGNYEPLDDLLTVVAQPFEDHPEHAALALPPTPEQVVQQTFCGT